MRRFCKPSPPSLLLSLVLAGCASAAPPAPPPDHPIPAPPPLLDAGGDASGDHDPWPDSTPPLLSEVVAAPAPPPTPVAAATDPSAAGDGQPAPAPRAPDALVHFEPPYKMGARPKPASEAAYLADVRERRRWNDGGLGGAKAAMPLGHPNPRVIVDIASLRGPHSKKKVLRRARRWHWTQAVNCYRIGYHLDHELRGWTSVTVRLRANGSVRSSKLGRTELANKEVAQCLADKLATIRFAGARAGSRVVFRVRLGPGDDPVAPPDELIVPGEGEFDVAAVSAVVRSGLPALETCYRQRRSVAPGVWGRLVVRFHVDEHGALDEAFETESRFPDPRLKQCVLRAARGWTFPKVKGGEIRFELPLRFGHPPVAVASSEATATTERTNEKRAKSPPPASN
jgi:hypothetical protein